MSDTEHPEFCEAYAVWRNNGLTPLTAINGYAELLRRGAFGSLTDPQQQAIATILLNTQQAMHHWYLGTDYLHARYTPFTPTPLSVAALVADVQQRLQQDFPRLTVDIPADIMSMHGEYVQLVAALCHLIYPMDRLRECTNRAPHIHVRALPDQMLYIEVISSLSPQTEVADTERWLQYPGTFLQTAALIIQRHSGQIGVKQATESIGFTFTLPMAQSIRGHT
jgi:light-regulated signal transduction histidine kinase (bacteriophytochrome)